MLNLHVSLNLNLKKMSKLTNIIKNDICKTNSVIKEFSKTGIFTSLDKIVLVLV